MKQNKKTGLNPAQLFQYERSIDLADSLHRTIMAEYKYHPFTNQQLVCAIELLIEKFRNPQKPEAWVYLCAAIKDGIEENLERHKIDNRTANT